MFSNNYGGTYLKIKFLALALVLLSILSIPANAARLSMSYLYFGSPSDYIYRVQNSNGAINEVSPAYFELDAEGDLVVNDNGISEFVTAMKAEGVRVVPFLSNHWDRELGEAALDNMYQLTNQIVNVIEKYDLDGINIDIENLTEKHRDDFSQFILNLNRELPSNKTIAVAVAANPYGTNYGWQGSYDYAELAENCDYLMIMAYDEHYQGGEAGAIASYDFVENSIKYTLKHVSRDKIVVGIPYFGRIWSDNGELMNGNGLSDTTIQSMIDKYDGQVFTDSESGSTFAKINISEYDIKPTINGKKLTAGDYTIWYESDDDKKSLLRLIDQYNLKGSGSWSLGQENDSVWGYHSLWLNGLFFEDTVGHWAIDEIISANEKGLMNGFSDTSFAPDKNLTRAEAAVVMCRMLELEVVSTEVSFTDTVNHWASDYIETAKANGLITGQSEDIFAPNDAISREEIAVLFDRAIAEDRALQSNSIFSDVNSDANSWSIDAINRLVESGIINGYSDGTFRPFDDVTRAEFSAMLFRIS